MQAWLSVDDVLKNRVLVATDRCTMLMESVEYPKCLCTERF